MVSHTYRPSVTPGGDATGAAAFQARGVTTGIITSIDKDTSSQRVMVNCRAWGGGSKPARIVSPYSDELGRGFIAGIKKNTACLVMSVARTSGGEHDYYVIGFYQTNPVHLTDKSVLSGDIHLRSQNNSLISVFSAGDINIEADAFCTTYYNKVAQQINTKSRTHELETYTGWEKWTHSQETSTKGQTIRHIRVKRKVETGKGYQYVEEQGHLTGAEDAAVISRRRAYDGSGLSEDDPTSNLVFEEEVAEAGSFRITVKKEQGTVTIEQENGASVRLDKDGNIFVTAGAGKNIHINDAEKTAQKASRVGDATTGHSHGFMVGAAGFGVPTELVAAGGFVMSSVGAGPLSGETETDTIAEGSSTVMIGG